MDKFDACSIIMCRGVEPLLSMHRLASTIRSRRSRLTSISNRVVGAFALRGSKQAAMSGNSSSCSKNKN